MLGNRTWDEWVAQYSTSHQHPVNRACHTVGIPLIAISVAASPLILAERRAWKPIAATFTAGWALQFVGHAFEGKPPEFLKDYRFLFVGLRWWLQKVQGRV